VQIRGQPFLRLRGKRRSTGWPIVSARVMGGNRGGGHESEKPGHTDYRQVEAHRERAIRIPTAWPLLLCASRIGSGKPPGRPQRWESHRELSGERWVTTDAAAPESGPKIRTQGGR